MVSEDGRDAVAAVAGLQMNYNRFYEFFLNATRTCPRDYGAAACNLTCASPVMPNLKLYAVHYAAFTPDTMVVVYPLVSLVTIYIYPVSVTKLSSRLHVSTCIRE